MNTELTRRATGLVIWVAASLWIKHVTIEKATLSLWTWALGFALTLA
jgi:hypothetical protein